MEKLKRYSLRCWRVIQFLSWLLAFGCLLDDRLEPISRVAGGFVWLGIGLSYRLRKINETLQRASAS